MSEVLSELDAQEALFSAMQEDGGTPAGEQGQGSSEGSNAAELAIAAQREASQLTPQGDEVTPPETTPVVTEEQFTRLDPNTIPDDLKPWYQSMQADYTRKTQAVAEQRKQAEALLGDPEASQQALQFYNSLQDPQFAKNFYNQLGGTLTNLGYLEAAQEFQPQPAVVEPPVFNDPDEYFKAKAAELDDKYAAIEERLNNQQQQAEQAQLYAALAGEVQRQDAFIRDANPHYTDADLTAIHAMSGPDRTLMEAQEVYEGAVADRLNRMMQAKNSVANAVGLPAGVGSATEPPSFGDDLEAAHKAAQAKLREILAAD